jgi:hypothetical protein
MDETLRHTRSTVAAATWGPPDTGVVLARLEVDATQFQLWSTQVERATGVLVQPEHAVTIAVGRGLVAAPGLNRVVRLGRAAPRNGVAVTLVRHGRHRRVDDADAIDPTQLVALTDEVTDGPAWAQTDRTLSRVPAVLLRPVLRLVAWLGRIGASIPGLGIEPGAVGAAVVERGAGFDVQFNPPVPYAGTVLHAVVGDVTDAVVARAGEPVVRPVLRVDLALDARLCANDELDVLADVLRTTLEDPWALGVVERPAAATVAAEGARGRTPGPARR